MEPAEVTATRPAHRGPTRAHVRRVAETVAGELARAGARAVMFGGSYVDGHPHAESDLDLYALGRGDPYRLSRREGLLVSVCWRTVANLRRGMRDPSRVAGLVPGLRTSLILFDPYGVAAKIQRDARAWTWQLVEDRCDRWVAAQVTGAAEEVSKLWGGLRSGRRRVAGVQRFWLAIELTEALAVHLRILYGSENRTWDRVAARLGRRWAQWQDAALGLQGQDLPAGAAGAFAMYREAARRVGPLLNARQRAVVEHAVEICNSIAPALPA
jgi:hypothetical protein